MTVSVRTLPTGERLSAIVPGNPNADGYIVAKCLRFLRDTEVPDDGKRPPIKLEMRHSVLTECLELRAPTPLQRKKLQRLLVLRNIDAEMWDLHALDVVYPSPWQSSLRSVVPVPPPTAHPTSQQLNFRFAEASEDQSRPLGKPTKDLRSLEAELVHYCEVMIGIVHAANNLTAAQNKVIAEVLERFKLFWFRVSRGSARERSIHDPINTAAWQFLIEQAKRSEHDALQGIVFSSCGNR